MAYGTTGLRDVNGVVHLTGFSPPEGPSQDLVAAALDLGLPLTDLRVRYRLDRRDGFVLEEARMQLADGSITVEPATVPLTGFERVPLTLHVSEVDLQRLAAMTPLSDLSVSGKVSGTVPMVITPGAVRIDAGRLTAIGPGTLSYTGNALPAESPSVDLARRALRDFAYRDLSLEVTGGTQDSLALAIRLEGSNPEVLGGHPFQFNLAFDGPLTQLIQEGLQGYTIPNQIRKRLQSMGLSPNAPGQGPGAGGRRSDP